MLGCKKLFWLLILIVFYARIPADFRVPADFMLHLPLRVLQNHSALTQLAHPCLSASGALAQCC